MTVPRVTADAWDTARRCLTELLQLSPERHLQALVLITQATVIHLDQHQQADLTDCQST